MKNCTFKLITLTTLFMISSFTSAASIKKNSDYNFPLEVDTTAPAIIFPITLHGVPGDSQEVGLAITAGVASKHGKSVISSQQLYSMVGNMSYSLAEGMRKRAKKKKYSMDSSADELTSSIDELTTALKKISAVSDDYQFKYAIVLHVDSTKGSLSIPGTKLGVKRVVAFGGIIDIEKNEIVNFIEEKVTLANSDQLILGQMPKEMNNIVEKLLGA